MKNPILNAVHQTATGLRKSGAITDVTMGEFDKLCLQHLAQGELDVQNNRLTTQEIVFETLRTSLLAKVTEPKGLHHNSSDRKER
jgi:DNA-binding transcriptional regulator YiaG